MKDRKLRLTASRIRICIFTFIATDLQSEAGSRGAVLQASIGPVVIALVTSL